MKMTATLRRYATAMVAGWHLTALSCAALAQSEGALTAKALQLLSSSFECAADVKLESNSHTETRTLTTMKFEANTERFRVTEYAKTETTFKRDKTISPTVYSTTTVQEAAFGAFEPDRGSSLEGSELSLNCWSEQKCFRYSETGKSGGSIHGQYIERRSIESVSFDFCDTNTAKKARLAFNVMFKVVSESDKPWSNIVSSEDPADFRAFIEHYPRSKYANEARQRLANLESGPTFSPDRYLNLTSENHQYYVAIDNLAPRNGPDKDLPETSARLKIGDRLQSAGRLGDWIRIRQGDKILGFVDQVSLVSEKQINARRDVLERKEKFNAFLQRARKSNGLAKAFTGFWGSCYNSEGLINNSLNVCGMVWAENNSSFLLRLLGDDLIEYHVESSRNVHMKSGETVRIFTLKSSSETLKIGAYRTKSYIEKPDGVNFNTLVFRPLDEHGQFVLRAFDRLADKQLELAD